MSLLKNASAAQCSTDKIHNFISSHNLIVSISTVSGRAKVALAAPLCSSVPQPAEIGVAGSSSLSSAPGLHGVNEERGGPYGFVWICTQAARKCMCECMCVCVCERVFDLYAGHAVLKQQQFN